MAVLLAAADETQRIAGQWEGNISFPKMQLFVSIDLRMKPDGSWEGVVDIPAREIKGAALENISVDGANVEFQIQDVPGSSTFSGELKNERIAGNFTQAEQSFPFELVREVASPN
jgi:hypothetical protein